VRTPAQPCFTAWCVSSIVSVSAAQPLPAMIDAAGTPAAITASSAAMRSPTENEVPSPVVPKSAMP